MSFGEQLPTSKKTLLYCVTLKMNGRRSLQTCESIRHRAEQPNLQQYRCEKLKSQDDYDDDDGGGGGGDINVDVYINIYVYIYIYISINTDFDSVPEECVL
jgi:hypothetical protein